MQSHFPRYSSLLHPISPPKPRLPRNDSLAAPAWWGVPLVYLVAIAGAEVVATLSDVRSGLISHAFILSLLLFHGLASQDLDVRALLHSLALVPFMRVLTLAVPMLGVNEPAATAATVVLTLAAAGLVARGSARSRADLDLIPKPDDRLLAVPAIVAGIGLGLASYELVGSEQRAIPEALIAAIIAQAFVLTSANRLFGPLSAAVYTAALCLIPYLAAPPQAGIAFAASLVFATATLWSRSVVTAVFGYTTAAATLVLLAPRILA